MDRAEWFGQKGVRGCKEGALLGSLSWRGTCRSWGAGTPLQGCCWTPSPKKSCSMWGASQGVEHKWDQAGGRDGYRVCGCCSGSRQHLRRPDGGQRVRAGRWAVASIPFAFLNAKDTWAHPGGRSAPPHRAEHLICGMLG